MITFLELADMVDATQEVGGGVMITFLEMHVWLGVSHRCFQKAFVAILTHVLQEKKADCHVVRAPDSL